MNPQEASSPPLRYLTDDEISLYKQYSAVPPVFLSSHIVNSLPETVLQKLVDEDFTHTLLNLAPNKQSYDEMLDIFYLDDDLPINTDEIDKLLSHKQTRIAAFVNTCLAKLRQLCYTTPKQ